MKKPKRQQTEAETKLVEKLARKPRHLYPFHNAGSKDYIAARMTIYRAKESLIEDKIIELQETRDNRKTYDLTLLGWVLFSGKNRLTNGNIKRIKEKFKESIPLVFGEWEYFKKEGIEELAKKHLSNTLKICELKYQTELLKDKRRKVDLKNKKSLIVNETKLAYEITKIFLFNGLDEEFFLEFEDLINEIVIEETYKLEKVFDKHNKLYLFRFEQFKFQKLKNSLNHDNFFFSNILDSYNLEPSLSAILTSKINKANGVESLDIKLVESIYNADYFTATIQLCKIYQNFWFESYREIITEIVEVMNRLAYIRIRDIIEKIDCNLNEIENKWNSELPKLRHKSMIEILAAFTFFKLQTTQICYVPGITHNFNKLSFNFFLKKLDQNKKQARAEAISVVENYIRSNNISLELPTSIELEQILKHLLRE